MTGSNFCSACSLRRLAAFAAVLGLVVIALVANWRRLAGAPQAVVVHETGVMSTDVRVTVMARDRDLAKGAISDALARFGDVDRLMSVFKPESEVSQANARAAYEPVPLSSETAECLAIGLRVGEQTGGAFDITVKPLVELWRGSARRGSLPSEEDVAGAKERVGFAEVLLDADAGTVRFARPGMALDLGGVAKGYAVDLAYRALAARGHPDALVDAGGDLYAGGTRGGRAWRVGVQDPRIGPHEPPSAVMVLEVRDRAVATSGNYRRFSTIEGRRISHILDPRTGQPADAVPSATVVAPDCATADALATAFSVLSVPESLALADAMPGVEALLMTVEDGELVFHRSAGFGRYEVGR